MVTDWNVKAGDLEGLKLLIDQGADDAFLSEQLRPGLLQAACDAANQPLQLRLQSGYDHSYWFIQSFIEEHLRFHAGILLDTSKRFAIG